jgi:hypothetical protein
LFEAGIKKRLGMVGDEYTTFDDIMVRAIVEDNTTMPEILARPEEDAWTYLDDQEKEMKP